MRETTCKKKNVGMAAALMLFFVFALCLNGKRVQAADYLSATPLPVNGAWTGDTWLTDTEEEYWYRITIPSDGKLVHKVMAYTYVRYQLYNADLSQSYYWGWESSSGTETSPDTDAFTLSLSAGTYYLKVWKGDNGKFRVNAEFTSYGVNDGAAVSYDSPQNISLGQTITGALTKTDGEDWYRITISAPGTYSYRVSAYTSVRYYLKNADLSTEISYGSSYGKESVPDTDVYNVVLSPGTYYFRVYEGDTGKYTFSFSRLSQSTCAHDYRTSYVSATYAKKGYTLHKMLGSKELF